jgi:elongation factor P
MKTARELKEGETTLIDGELYRVVSLLHHAGTGQQPGMVKATLRNMKTGRVIERRWSLEEHLQDVDLERVDMQFLYADENEAVFMHTKTYEQFSLARSGLEHFLPFFKEGEVVPVEFYEGEPVSVDTPKLIPLFVSSCGQGIKGQRDSPMKEATLENGMTVMVPHFIQAGDTIIIDVRTGKYVDRQRKT